jgi:hypothetical protein
MYRWATNSAVILAFPVVSIVLNATRSAATTVDQLCPPNADPCVVSKRVSVVSGSFLDLGERSLEISRNGSLVSPGGNLSVVAKSVLVGGRIDVSGTVGGRVTLRAALDLRIEGAVSANGTGQAGEPGTIHLTAESLFISGEVTSRGGSDATGGDITTRARHGLVISGQIDASGGDGGNVSLKSGGGGRSGTIKLAPKGMLRADGSAVGGLGGAVVMKTRRGGNESGDVTLEGFVSASAHQRDALAGAIRVNADGDLLSRNTDAALDASSGTEGYGGEVSLSASGRVDYRGAIKVEATAELGGGGVVTIRAKDGVLLAGPVKAGGGGFDGGEILVESEAGDVVITSTGRVDVADHLGGLGGSICLASGRAETGHRQPLIVNGALDARGRGRAEDFAGDGGFIELLAGGPIQVRAPLNADGAPNGGFGGALSVRSERGPISIEQSMSARGLGTRGLGGTVRIEAPQADVTVRGELRADAGTEADRGGTIYVGGCTVTIEEQAALSSVGVDGRNALMGRNGASVKGTLIAGSRNEIGFTLGEPQICGSISPDAVIVRDPSAKACNGNRPRGAAEGSAGEPLKPQREGSVGREMRMIPVGRTCEQMRARLRDKPSKDVSPLQERDTEPPQIALL